MEKRDLETAKQYLSDDFTMVFPGGASFKKIEDLMQILVKDFSILIVTHNMQQASRVSNYCAFFTTKATDDGRRTGELVEYSDTKTMFTNPSESLTEEYISGRFG